MNKSCYREKQRNMDLKKELVTTIENKQKLHDKYKDLRKDCQALLRTYKKSE